MENPVQEDGAKFGIKSVNPLSASEMQAAKDAKIALLDEVYEARKNFGYAATVLRFPTDLNHDSTMAAIKLARTPLAEALASLDRIIASDCNESARLVVGPGPDATDDVVTDSLQDDDAGIGGGEHNVSAHATNLDTSNRACNCCCPRDCASAGDAGGRIQRWSYSAIYAALCGDLDLEDFRESIRKPLADGPANG